MVTHMTIPIAEDEHTAIRTLAREAMRPTRDHIRWMLRTELQRLGMLTPDSPPTAPTALEPCHEVKP